MKLDLAQIRSITLGAVRVEEKEDGFRFYRFTEEQEEFYRQTHGHCANVFATSGMKFRFRTDSDSLSLSIHVQPTGTRSYFSVDVFVNSVLVDDIRNFEETEIPRRYTAFPLPTGNFSASFELEAGEKEIEIHLPWNMETAVKELVLSDGASLEPVRPEKKLLCFGDSITQGYDALHPSRRYTAQLARYLEMEEHNLAIGGEKFRPGLAACPVPFRPDLITVAYGTNDWRHRTREEFDKMCHGFFENLTKAYPDTPVLAIAPIWRKVCDKVFDCGPFRDLPSAIRHATRGMKNVTVVDGFPFIPPFSDYFADLTLHPNGAGYDRYFEGLKAFFESNR